MSEVTRQYYLERARISLEKAEKAVNPRIAEIHAELHSRYTVRAQEELKRPRLGPIY